jgi:hypothetical protein
VGFRYADAACCGTERNLALIMGPINFQGSTNVDPANKHAVNALASCQYVYEVYLQEGSLVAAASWSRLHDCILWPPPCVLDKFEIHVLWLVQDRLAGWCSIP